jgi:phosphoglycerate dehydrogenase-like enzyme
MSVEGGALRVLRWHRSAYETDADLARERADAEALGCAWSLWPETSLPPDIGRADVLVVTSGVRVSGDALARYRGGLVIATTSGFDHIDLAACRARGVIVARSPLARRDAVVEAALAAMITLRRRLVDQALPAVAGRWDRAALPALAPQGLDGAAVAVVGLGVIGRRMCEVLSALGARVLPIDPAVAGALGPDALAEADVVTLHCSLSPSSRGLLDATRLRSLRRGAVVVNTARGEVLDVAEAVALVASGHLRGVAVDVFPVEPYPHLADGAAVPGVIFTPHAAGYTADLGARVAASVQATLAAWVAGRPPPYVVGADAE